MNNIINLFIAPKKLYSNIKDKPTFLLPLSIVIILIVVTQYLMTFTIIATPEYLSSQMLEATGNVELANMYLNTPQQNINVLVFLTTAITSIISILFLAGFILLLSKVFGGEGSYKKFLSMSSYNSIITYFFGFLTVIFMILLNTPRDIFSVATILMPNGGMFNILFIVLTTISIPTIYIFVLNVLGIKEISNFKTTTKPIIISFILYAIPLLLQIIMVLINMAILKNI